jgi:hypothetical protein
MEAGEKLDAPVMRSGLAMPRRCPQVAAGAAPGLLFIGSNQKTGLQLMRYVI